ncbi:zf-HC2 domain-containing protein [Streptomyces olivaceus]|uniref:zf-HC2 domain-containing protein n=1 Tax=Streptomyces olivaceus TaxID=47716 RepID=UPI0035D7A335
MNTGEDPHLDVGAYVLHALPPDEAAAFEKHLANCAACRREVEELSGPAALLGAAEARTPSPDLRDRVLGLITGVRQERGGLREPLGAHSQETPGRTTGAGEQRYRRRARRLGLALAASVAAAAALGGATGGSTRRPTAPARRRLRRTPPARSSPMSWPPPTPPSARQNCRTTPRPA